MKFSIATIGLMLLCFTPVQAQESTEETTDKEARAAAQANQCVVSGKSWRECLGLPPTYSIVTSKPPDLPPLQLDHIFPRREVWQFRGPWDKTAVDFLMDPNFHRTNR